MRNYELAVRLIEYWINRDFGGSSERFEQETGRNVVIYAIIIARVIQGLEMQDEESMEVLSSLVELNL